MIKKFIFLILALFLLSGTVFSATLTLKTGEKIAGEIIEQTDEYVKIKTLGIDVMYFAEEIENIDTSVPALPNVEVKESSPQEKIGEILKHSDKIYFLSFAALHDLSKLLLKYFAKIMPEFFPKIELITNDAFQMSRYRAAMQEQFANSFNQDYAISLLRWLKSPLGQKIGEAEIKNWGLSVEAGEKEAFIDEITNKPFSQERIDLVKKLNDFLGVSGSLAQGQLYVFTTKMRLVNILYPAQATVTEEKYRLGLEKIKEAQLTDKTKVLNRLLFTYKEFSNSELTEYVNFLDSAAGKWFSEIFKKTKQAILDAIDRDILKKTSLLIEQN